MPILILGLAALAVFVVIGLMLFGATLAESRDRTRGDNGAAKPPEEKQLPGAHRGGPADAAAGTAGAGRA